MNSDKSKSLFLFKKAVYIILGAGLVGVALEIFLVPNDIIDGGITGISIISSHYTHVPLSIFLTLFNIPFLILGYKHIGKTFALSTLVAVILMSVSAQLLLPVTAFTKDPFLAAVFGGIILGVGVGLVIRTGGSMDGTEILAIIYNQKTPFSVGELIMVINVFILGCAGFVFGWNHAMYSLIAYFIAYKMIDLTIEGLEQSKLAWIISTHNKVIGQAILQRLGRGVTYLQGEGGYSGDDKQVIFCVITRLEEAKLKAIIDDLDPSAFLAIGNIHDVRGGRFKKKAIH